MNKYLVISLLIVSATISFALGALWYDKYHNIDKLLDEHYYDMTIIEAYEQYYRGAETLLEEINDQYNWVDGFDNYDYYEGREKIEKLKINIYGQD